MLACNPVLEKPFNAHPHLHDPNAGEPNRTNFHQLKNYRLSKEIFASLTTVGIAGRVSLIELPKTERDSFPNPGGRNKGRERCKAHLALQVSRIVIAPKDKRSCAAWSPLRDERSNRTTCCAHGPLMTLIMFSSTIHLNPIERGGAPP